MKHFDPSKIRKFREEAKLTQEGLAIAMSTPENRVHVQQVSEWERSINGGLTVKTLTKLCEALGKTTDDFFVTSL